MLARAAQALVAALAAVAAVSSTLAFAATTETAATEHRCTGVATVVVRAAAAADAQAACEGAERGARFLHDLGLPAPDSSTIDIVDQLPVEVRGQAIGCFLRDTRRILLLTYDAFEATGRWLRMPVNRELYRSAAAHEMAHAVIACHSGPGDLPVPAHEYAAYVVMFATMDPALRDDVLARFAGRGFDNVLQINTIVYLADPLQFAADAWRHYLKRRDRAAWLRDVIAGRVVQIFPLEGP